MIPESFGLAERKRDDGKVELVGKADDGSDYVARTCDGQVTPEDIEALARVDRTRVTAQDIANDAVSHREKYWQGFESQMEDEYMEAAGPAVRAGMGKATFGYSRKYARNFQRVFGEQ